jgi:hypothetical protein
MQIDKDIINKTPSNGFELMYLLLNSMPISDLEVLIKRVKKTRKRAIVFGFNGSSVRIPRAIALKEAMSKFQLRSQQE